MKKELLKNIILVIAGALLLSMISCVDDINKGDNQDEVMQAEQIPQFCWVEHMPEGTNVKEAGVSMSSFDDNSFVVVGETCVFECPVGDDMASHYQHSFISRFTADGTLEWKHDLECDVDSECDVDCDWIHSVPSEGTTMFLQAFRPRDDQSMVSGYLTKLDANGEQLWSQLVATWPKMLTVNEDHTAYNPPWVTANEDHISWGIPWVAADVTSSGSVVVAAAFSGEIVLGEGQPTEIRLNTDGSDILGMYVAHFSNTGDLLSAKQIQTAVVPFDLRLTASEEVLIAGMTDFSLQKITIVKTSIDGEERWSESAIRVPDTAGMGKCDERRIRLLPRADGSFTLTGTFLGEISVHGGETDPIFLSLEYDLDREVTETTYFLANFSPDGTLEWALSGRADGWTDEVDANPRSFSVLPNGDLLIPGRVHGSITFEHVSGRKTKVGGGGYFMAKYDSKGQLINVTPLGGAPYMFFSFDHYTLRSDGSMMYALLVDGEISLQLTDGSVFERHIISVEEEFGDYILLKICPEDL